MKTTVRASRSYMAGLGTSGSLVAGAALLFVLASAIVAFRGWPQVAPGQATSFVPAAARPPAPTRTSRRLVAVLRHRTSVRAAAVSGGGVLPPVASRGHQGVMSVSGVSGSTAPRRAAPAAGTNSASGAAVSASGVCGGSSCNSPQSLVTHLTKAVAQQVTSIGSSVGSQVGSTTGSVGGSLSRVNPQVASGVQNTGSGAGSAVSGTATSAGNAVNQVGGALGGGQ